MAADFPAVNDAIRRFHDAIRDLYPLRKLILFGSHARGTASAESDIDVAVVIDLPEPVDRLAVSLDLWRHAVRIHPALEPRLVLWSEYQHLAPASILSAMLRDGLDLAA